MTSMIRSPAAHASEKYLMLDKPEPIDLSFSASINSSLILYNSNIYNMNFKKLLNHIYLSGQRQEFQDCYNCF